MTSKHLARRGLLLNRLRELARQRRDFKRRSPFRLGDHRRAPLGSGN